MQANAAGENIVSSTKTAENANGKTVIETAHADTIVSRMFVPGSLLNAQFPLQTHEYQIPHDTREYSIDTMLLR